MQTYSKLLHSVPKGPKSGRASLKTRKGRDSLKTRKGRASLKTRKGRASLKTVRDLSKGKNKIYFIFYLGPNHTLGYHPKGGRS
jgi:hypothetical protein